jgi:succinate-acetate transporter protein
MEAGGLPREADVAPAAETAAPVAGWAPANPAALGLTGFATTTFVLSVINTGLVGGAAGSFPAVFGLTLVYGGLAQLLAGMWEFRTGNTFGAVAFTSYGAFWISFYVLAHSSLGDVPKNEIFSLIGLFLWAWTIFTAYMFIASLRTNGVVAAVFGLLLITFIFLAIGNSALAGTTSVTNGTIKIGGYLGIVTALVAWYGSGAIIINETWGRPVLPLFPVGG